VTTGYLPFIDWFKCLGMTLIVYGHVFAWGPLNRLAPINAKQLGVALFLFGAGYSLATDGRGRGRVLFNRLFEVFLFGLGVAALSSLLTGRLQPSNYLPFFLGANVLRDAFPANPTSWYLGTYIQLMVLWAAVMARRRVTGAVLACALAAEIVARAAIMQAAGIYTAYMLLPNWATVFLMGVWYGQARSRATTLSFGGGTAALALLGIALALWSIGSARLPFEASDAPFMRWIFTLHV
jgi:hypothetical protein